MAEVLQVEKRDLLGTANSRRLRLSGLVPAVLYGHKQDTQHLAITHAAAESIVRHHSKIVELQGAVTDTALVSDLQWDPLGIEVLHIDLQRVDLSEKIEVSVPIKIKGEPIGVRHGGIAIENVHEVDVRCSAVTIPEFLILTVLDVESGENRSASSLQIPEGVELLTPPETVVFTVETPKGAKSDDEEGAEGEAESQE